MHCIALGIFIIIKAVISQHFEFAMLLIKEGANIDIKDATGKTPAQWAEEKEVLEAWLNILADVGKQFSKRPSRPFDKNTTNRFLYAIPFVMIPLSFLILGFFAFYIALPVLFFTLMVVQRNIVVRYLLGDDAGSLINTPLAASIVHASLFYLFITWIRIIPGIILTHISHTTFNILSFHLSFYSDSVLLLFVSRIR